MDDWPVKAVAPPNLTPRQWWLSHLLALIFLAAAILQLINFHDFADNFGALAYPTANLWAGAIIFVELMAAFGFLRVRQSWGFRAVTNYLAVIGGLFWLVNSLRTLSNFDGASIDIDGRSAVVSNFFGRYLTQAAGWWTVIEATVFLLLVLYTVEIMRLKAGRYTASPVRVTKINR